MPDYTQLCLEPKGDGDKFKFEFEFELRVGGDRASFRTREWWMVNGGWFRKGKEREWEVLELVTTLSH